MELISIARLFLVIPPAKARNLNIDELVSIAKDCPA